MPRNKYPEETVQKILDTSLRLFLEKGYEQTTILDIVNNLGGLTRGAFYHHFRSKEDVLDALSDKLFTDNNPFEKAKQQKHLNGLEKLKYAIAENRMDKERLQIASMSLYALESSPTFLKMLIDDNRDVVSPLFQELIEEGINDGSIVSKHPKLLAELTVLLTNFWLIPTLYPSSDEEQLEKFLYIKEITEKLGLPLIDNQTVTAILDDFKESKQEKLP